MRISDWSSDVCSSDLREADRLSGGAEDRLEGHPAQNRGGRRAGRPRQRRRGREGLQDHPQERQGLRQGRRHRGRPGAAEDRTSGVEGKSVEVRVDMGGSRSLKKKKEKTKLTNE